MKLLVHHNHHHRCSGHHHVNKKHHRGGKVRSHTRSGSRTRDRSRSRSRSRTRRHHRKQHHSRMDHFHGKCSDKRVASSSSSSSGDSTSRSPTPPTERFHGQRHGCGRRLMSHFRAKNVYPWHPGHAKCSGCSRHEDKHPDKSAPTEKNQDLVQDLTADCCESDKAEDELEEIEKDNLAEGTEIDGVLATTWTEVALKGLPDEIKKSFLDKYRVSKNCSSLLGPRLNSEILDTVKKSVVVQDEDQMKVQTEVGAGLSALGQAITALNNSKEVEITDIMDTLNEAALIIVDAHHDLTKARRALICKKMNEEIGTIIEICQPTNELLFGNELKDKFQNKNLEKHEKIKGRNSERQQGKREKCNKPSSDGEKDKCKKCRKCKK